MEFRHNARDEQTRLRVKIIISDFANDMSGQDFGGFQNIVVRISRVIA